MKKILIMMIMLLTNLISSDIYIQVASLKQKKSIPVVKNNIVKLNTLKKNNIFEKTIKEYTVIYYKDITKLTIIQTKYDDAFLIHKTDISKNIILKSKRTIRVDNRCDDIYLRIHKKKIKTTCKKKL